MWQISNIWILVEIASILKWGIFPKKLEISYLVSHCIKSFTWAAAVFSFWWTQILSIGILLQTSHDRWSVGHLSSQHQFRTLLFFFCNILAMSGTSELFKMKISHNIMQNKTSCLSTSTGIFISINSNKAVMGHQKMVN